MRGTDLERAAEPRLIHELMASVLVCAGITGFSRLLFGDRS
ncbi:MAG TPA: hypothetical protein VFO16_20345 [Pseudonocardiaceae bacterium]|nr:hypothetical protein [Pseudonocardiaceae bacterium]